MMSHTVIQTLLEKGQEVMVSKAGVRVEGFYKSGSVLLTENTDGTLTAKARYDEDTRIEDFDDLVYLNFNWWLRSKARGWGDPDTFWLKEFQRLNLVRTKTVETVEVV